MTVDQLLAQIDHCARRSKWCIERICEGRAIDVPAYHRWAAMYAIRRRRATKRLQSLVRPLTKRQARLDLRWILERLMPEIVAAHFATTADEVRRWARSGPPTWRYEPIANVRKRLESSVD